MSSAHANRYTPEFKQKAVQLYESRSPVTYAEVARELGIDAGTLSKWVAQARPSEDADESDNPFQMAEDLRKLRRENERLKRENEILLKASAFFASRQL
jgi:transposase